MIVPEILLPNLSSAFSRENRSTPRPCAGKVLALLLCLLLLPFVQQSALAQTQSVTTLTVTANGSTASTVALGATVTLTATVKAGTTPVTTGQIQFCDASEAYCTDVHLLGSAQLTSAGTAAIKLRPGIGSHSFKASFLGTTSYQKSASSATSLAVSGKFPASIDVAATGVPGNYTVTGTLSVVVNNSATIAPAGSVSFLDSQSGSPLLASASLGAGTASLTSRVGSAFTLGPTSYEAAADFNGDGVPDLAIANNSTSTTTIQVLLGTGDGNFNYASGSLSLNSFPASVVSGDWNSDGKIDLAVVLPNDNRIQVFLGNGDGSFGAAINKTVSGIQGRLVSGDFNSDGIPDLAVADNNAILVFPGIGDGTFGSASATLSVPKGVVRLAVGDFNGDGKADLAATQNGEVSVSIFLGNGAGAFTAASANPAVTGTPFDVAVADFNHDGKLDLAVSNASAGGAVSVLLGKGDGTFQAAQTDTNYSGTAQKLVVGDFNGDGYVDLALSDTMLSLVIILPGAGDGSFGTYVSIGGALYGNDELASADFNGDGIPDFAVSTSGVDFPIVLMQPTMSYVATVNGVSVSGPGSHNVSASYAGDSTYQASTSTSTAQLFAVFPNPSLSPAPGTYSSVQSVTIAEAIPGASIKYAISGPVSTNGYVSYTGPISLSIGGMYEIMVDASADGYQFHGSTRGIYIVNLPTAPKPTFSLTTGLYASAQTVTLTDDLGGATIYYTTDGTWPTTSSPVYSGPITVSSTETIAAFAVAPGYSPSSIASEQYFLSTSANSFIYTIAGNANYGFSGDNGPATTASLNTPMATVVDGSGNIYISDSANNVVRKVAASTGIITTVAGTGISGYSGDNGAATGAQLNSPAGLAVDSSGNLYISDEGNNVVRKVDAGTGTITTYAGSSTAKNVGDGGPASSAQLYNPEGLAIDSSGNLYIGTWTRVRKVDAGTGVITTVAGNGLYGFSGDNGLAINASVNRPNGLALDKEGNLYIADPMSYSVRKVAASTGIITTVAGVSGSYPVGLNVGDGGPATSAFLNYPNGVAVDSSGNLYIADTLDFAIRKVTASTGIISSIAGHPYTYVTTSGDGGPASLAAMESPYGVSIDGSGNLYVAETGMSRIRKITPSSVPPTATTATPTFSVSAGSYATSQTVSISESTPGAQIYVTLDGTTPKTQGAGYQGPIAVTGSVTVKAIAVAPGYLPSSIATAAYTITTPPSLVLSTVAGTGYIGVANGTDGLATNAILGFLNGVAVDAAGNQYFPDTQNEVVWKVSASTGNISVVAGTLLQKGNGGDGGLAISAMLNSPTYAVVDHAGNLYISDTGNNVVRKVDATTGIISIYAGGNGTSDPKDGGPATSAGLGSPEGLVLDASGNLYIADSSMDRVRRVDATSGIITTVAGGAQFSTSVGDGGPATSAWVNTPWALALDPQGNLFIAQRFGGRIRKVAAGTGIITTIAGIGNNGQSGNGGPASSAEVSAYGVEVDHSGNVYIANWPNSIRVVSAETGVIKSFAGIGYPGTRSDGGSAEMAELLTPSGLVLDHAGNMYFAEIGTGRIRKISLSVAAPTFSLAAGSYSGAQDVTISEDAADTTIYYTTDGSTPTPSSNVYSSPVTITNSMTLKAIAVGLLDAQSSVSASAYTITAGPATVTITPSASSVTTAQSFTVTVAVSGGKGEATPTGSVTLSSGSYSAQQTLSSGAAIFTIPSGALPIGVDVLTATYTPDSAGSVVYLMTTQTSLITVTSSAAGTASVLVTPAAITITDQMSDSVAVSVSGPSGQATPTGSISFTAGSYSAVKSLVSGSMSFTIPAGALSSGNNTVTASYLGDTLYGSSTGTATITEAVAALTVPAPNPVTAGGSVTSNVTLSAGSSYAGTMALTCTLTSSPSGAQSLPSCSVSPANLTIAAAGTGSTVVTVKTTAASTSTAANTLNPFLRIGGGGVAFAGLFLLGVPSRRRRLASMLILLVFFAVAGIIGCGGGKSSGGGTTTIPATTSGQYTFTITGTDTASAKITTSTKFSITVQ